MKLRISLELQGVMSGFQARLPTPTEIDTCVHVELTEQDTWDPSSDELEKQELLKESRLSTVAGAESTMFSDRKSEVSAVLSAVSSTLVVDEFVRGMEESVRITSAVASSTVRTKSRHSTMEPMELSRHWGIGLLTAQKTLRVTTQKGLRTAVHPLHRRYRTQQQQLRYNHLNSKFYSDTMFSSSVSVRGNTCGQIFVNDLNYSKFIPLKSKGDARMALEELFQDVGVPTHMHTNGAKELTTGHWRKVCQSYGPVKQTVSEPLTPWQNRAESEIRELKKQVLRIMTHEGVPQRFWDYVAEYVSEIWSRTAHPLYDLKGRTAIEHVTGETPDITEWLEYRMYQPVWYLDPGYFPEEKKLLGRWLGPAHRVGQAFCCWIAPKLG
jgi:hypothetical protein